MNALVFRAISRIWNVRGNATFSSIFEFQCYMVAISLPTMALDLLLGPWLALLVELEILPAGSNILILASVAFVIDGAGLLFWNFPRNAIVNGVSTRRVWAGFLFWPAVLGFVGPTD